MGEIIQLTTPKGKKVIVNFSNVDYCKRTSNNHTSLSLGYTIGNPGKSAYVVVTESFDEILSLLNGE